AMLVDTETADGTSEIEECSQDTSLVEDKTHDGALSTGSEVLIASPYSSEELPRVALDNETALSELEMKHRQK
ncbi:hypothetical protein, partial [Staphylococcus aureus]|uniref:hypothetical protein n=1 Tax=Staphylococcus aureus TaxID=1280 RepID=UPI0038B2F3FE